MVAKAFKALPFVLIAAFVLAISPASAEYGAVAADQATGSVGWATDADSEASARAKATEGCSQAGGKTCGDVDVFQNSCGALARSSDDKSWGLSVKATRAAAQEDAIKKCTEEGGADAGCNVHDTFCSPQDWDR